MSDSEGIPLDHDISIDDELWRQARERVPAGMTDSKVIALALATFVRINAVKLRPDLTLAASEPQHTARTAK